MNNLFRNIATTITFILLLIASGSAGYFWWKSNNVKPVSTVEYVPVETIKYIDKIRKVPVPVETIVTIEKEVLVEKIKLPEWFVENESKQAIATAVIQPYEGKTNVIAVIDTKSGVGEIIAKQEALSLMGFQNDKEIYGKLGYNTDRELQVAVGGRWLFARIGKIKIGVYGEGQTNFKTNEASSNINASAGLVLTF